MKRRIIMGVAAVSAAFSTENVIDILVSRHTTPMTEIQIWVLIALASSAVVYEIGEERGDW